MSAAASYRHFASKEEVLVALAARGFEAFGDALESEASGSANPLSAMAVAYVQFAAARPARFRLMFGPAISDRSRYPALGAAARRSFQKLTDAIAVQDPGDDGGNASAVGAWALAHGLATLIIVGMLPVDDIPRLVRSVLAARGITPGDGAGLPTSN